jgi:hypothetical protein
MSPELAPELARITAESAGPVYYMSPRNRTAESANLSILNRLSPFPYLPYPIPRAMWRAMGEVVLQVASDTTPETARSAAWLAVGGTAWNAVLQTILRLAMTATETEAGRITPTTAARPVSKGARQAIESVVRKGIQRTTRGMTRRVAHPAVCRRAQPMAPAPAADYFLSAALEKM